MLIFPGGTKTDYRVQFLPSALEIIEKPESPLGRRIIWIIFSMLAIAILGSVIGQVDEVAVAPGKIIPDGNIKVIQSLEGGVVNAIHVHEGDRVKKGQLLIELDTTINRAELGKLKTSLETAKVERALLQAEQSGNRVQIDQLLKENSHLIIDPALLERQRQLKVAQKADFDQKQAAIEIEVDQSRDELAIAQNQLTQIETKINILENEVNTQKTLYASGVISEKELTDKENELKLAEQQKKQQESQVQYYQTQIRSKQNSVILGSAEYKKTLMEEIVAKDKVIQELEPEVEKMDKRVSLQTVVAPVDGLVQGVGANTIGGVVSSEKPIVTIVPDYTPLIVEATVLNKDIGFVHSGQKVDIKLDTFPFQKYGSIPGSIVQISPDAIQDEKLGYVYKIKVKPEVDTIRVGENSIPISPGMTAQAEIKTGNRRIIEFFLPGVEEVKDGFELR